LPDEGEYFRPEDFFDALFREPVLFFADDFFALVPRELVLLRDDVLLRERLELFFAALFLAEDFFALDFFAEDFFALDFFVDDFLVAMR
jgi:hypothetical protein